MPDKQSCKKKPPARELQAGEPLQPKRNPKLTPRQVTFVQRFTTHWNAARAAREAGYSESSAKVIGARLLTYPHIAALVQEAAKAQAAHANITAERTWVEIGRIGYFDPRMLYDEHGKRKELGDLSPNEAAAVGIEEHEIVERTAAGENRVLRYRGFRYNINDKLRALALLARRKDEESTKDHLREIAAAIHAPFIAMQKREAAEKAELLASNAKLEAKEKAKLLKAASCLGGKGGNDPGDPVG